MLCNCALNSCARVPDDIRGSRLLIIGEAPGADEEREGKPFVGRSGKLLFDALKIEGMKREDFDIMNIVSCRPPGNKMTSTIVKACLPHFRQRAQRLENITHVLCLGGTALYAVTVEKNLSDNKGKFLRPHLFPDAYVTCTYHPAATMHNPATLPVFKTDVGAFAQACKGTLSAGLNLDIPYATVNSGNFQQFITELWAADFVSYDIETEDAYGNPTLAHEDPGSRISIMALYLHPSSKVWSWPRPFFHHDFASWISKYPQAGGHNVKFDNRWLWKKLGYTPYTGHDTMVLSHILDENSPHGLEWLAMNYLRAPAWKSTSAANMALYNVRDAYLTGKLNAFLHEKLTPRQKMLYQHAVMPAYRAIESIEQNGLGINLSKMSGVKAHLSGQVDHADRMLLGFLPRLEDHPVNQVHCRGDRWASPLFLVAMAQYLKVKLEVTDKGNPSFDKSAMEKYAAQNDFFLSLAEWKKSQKLLQFISQWETQQRGGRLYPTYRIIGTKTGRLSCAEPNVQQIPRDKAVRSLICALPGNQLIVADFSQIELRIAAEVFGDDEMKRLYREGADIHRSVASAIYRKPEAEITKEERSSAKACAFG